MRAKVHHIAKAWCVSVVGTGTASHQGTCSVKPAPALLGRFNAQENTFQPSSPANEMEIEGSYNCW